MPINSERLHDCLRRLIRHVDSARIALTGGVAIGVHVGTSHGDRARGIPAEDIDFVADDVGAVCQTVTNDFLVSHFHVPQPGYPKFLVQLVDPVTRLRVDIFPDTLEARPRASAVDVAGVSLLLLRPDDILDHKLATLSRASETNPADPKHYADARTLADVCGRHVPPVETARLAVTTYSRDVGEQCARCEVSRHPEFPLAPKRAILNILGYV